MIKKALKMMIYHFKVMVIVLLVLMLFAVVGTLDYEDAKIEHEYNCNMVELGYYPKHFCK